jgi:hypothetical protein
MAHTGKYHGKIGLIRRFNDLSIAYRSTGLDYGTYPGLGCGLDTISEGYECV